MKKTLEELKGLSMEEIEKYFKETIEKEFEIDSAQFEGTQTFISEVGKKDGLETLIDVMQAIKEKGLTENQLILALAAKISETNMILNKLFEAEKIIKMIQFRDKLQGMAGKITEEGLFPDANPYPNFKEQSEEEEK